MFLVCSTKMVTNVNKICMPSSTTPYTVFPVGWQLGYQLTCKQRFKSQT